VVALANDMNEQTTLSVRTSGVPLKTMKVKVTQGPDTGLERVAERDTLTIGTADGNDLKLSDPTVSRFHLELRRRGDRVRLVDLGSTNGTRVRDGLVSEDGVWLTAGAVLELGQTQLTLSDGGVVMVDPAGSHGSAQVRGQSNAMRRTMAQVERLAHSDASVLLLGESGTGKELLARELHERSPRAKKPFVIVDCGALATDVFVSELFGHEKGSFTGADARHEGAFERAHEGTLLLDEVGELSLPVQAALLGALERRTVRRLGGRADVPVDVRVLAATHRNLRAQVNAGTFRLDLYYRLAVVTIEVPALRDRREDVRALIEHFLESTEYRGRTQALFSEEHLRRLETHDWPGNVRELRNLVIAAAALGQPAEPSAGAPPAAPSTGDLARSYREARGELLREFERNYLTQLLQRSKGNVRQAARDAQMDRSYLIELLKRHGLA
jgi:DNA-binding NtrC family response regulator